MVRRSNRTRVKNSIWLACVPQKTIYKWIALTKLDKQDEPNDRPGTKLDDQFISRITQILNDDPFAKGSKDVKLLLHQKENILKKNKIF